MHQAANIYKLVDISFNLRPSILSTNFLLHVAHVESRCVLRRPFLIGSGLGIESVNLTFPENYESGAGIDVNQVAACTISATL